MSDSVTRRDLLAQSGALAALGLTVAAGPKLMAGDPRTVTGTAGTLQSPTYLEGPDHHLATAAITAGEDSG